MKCLPAAGKMLITAAEPGTEGELALLEIDVDQYISTDSEDRLKGYKDLDGLAARLESALGPLLSEPHYSAYISQWVWHLTFALNPVHRAGRCGAESCKEAVKSGASTKFSDKAQNIKSGAESQRSSRVDQRDPDRADPLRDGPP
eukprot:scaffold293903_cov40-Prasinocladus_malaysianus.AAC.1